MSKALQIMAAHLKKGGHGAIGKGAWNTLLSRGWHPQQITKVAPSMGMQVGGWVQNQMNQYPNASANIGASGLYNLGAAQKWVGKGRTQQEIEGYGSNFANTPRGRNTSRSGWASGFTGEAADWLNNKWSQDAAEALEDAELQEEAPEEDPKWATDLSQTLTDLTKQINEPAVNPAETEVGGGYKTPSTVGGGGTVSMKIKPKRGSRKKSTRDFRRSSWSMPTLNTGGTSGKAGNSSPVNV